MSRIPSIETTSADAVSRDRRVEALDDSELLGEVERLLAMRTRDIRLDGRLRDLYRKRTFRQSSRIVRAWMGWMIALCLLGTALNFTVLPFDAALQTLMPAAIIVLAAASVITIYRDSGMPMLLDSALVGGIYVTLIGITLIGIIAGPPYYERYTNVMIFTAITAIVIFPIPLSWTMAIAAVALILQTAVQMYNPVINIVSALATSLFLGTGLLSTVFARQSTALVSQKSFLLSLRDLKRVSDLALANTQLEMLARTDALTGVGNRRWIMETMDALTVNGDMAERVAILMCDIDHFKGLNDTLGHLEGDRCLREVANVIRDCIRPGIDHVARYGGEEFLVLLTGVDAFDARLAAERICRTVEASLLPNPGSGASRYVTVSIGFSTTTPARPASAERLQRQADEALYRAKSGGRNRVVAFDAVQEPAFQSLPLLATSR